jgi:bacterioferritin
MDDTLQALGEIYRHELTMIVRYVNFSIQVSGLDRLHLVELFEESATDSMGHAKRIGAKILALGGAPKGNVAENLASAPSDTVKMLEQALEDEKAAVRLYEAAIPLAKKDLALRETLVHILKDEQSSVDEIAQLLRK